MIKTTILPLCFLFGISQYSAQSNQGSPTPFINENKTTALTTEKGVNLWHSVFNKAGYRVDIDDNLTSGLIFSSHFWFGGVSSEDELKVSADLHGTLNRFRQGPFSTNNQYNQYNYLSKYFNSIWKVSKAEIIYHIDNHNQPGYIMPHGIKWWPGNGDASVGVGVDLAPFIDVDGDGVYNPHLGDYPCIKGDAALYSIYNDDVENNPDKIGVEIHLMIYQFASNDYIDSTTFMQLRVINRGTNSFSDFKTSIFIDFDIGSYNDDYVGSNPSKNMIYGYNSNNFDNDFGENPPACGIVSLDRAMAVVGFFNNASWGEIPGFSDDPFYTEHYWNYMNAKWKDGSPFLNGGPGHNQSGNFPDLQPTNFLFDGNPLTNTGWTEASINSTPGDRRGFMTMEGQSLNPGQSAIYDLVIIMNRSGDHLQNVGGLFEYADLVQSYYNNLANHNCTLEGTGVSENQIPFDWSPWMVEVQRLDGRGNMGFAIDLVEESFNEVLEQNQTEYLKYKKNKSPIYVKIEDPGSHALGRFVLEFNNYGVGSTAIDTASWTIYRYDIDTDELLDEVSSETTISIGDLQYIPQWGISVQIKNQAYFIPPGLSSLPVNRATAPIQVSFHFEDQTEGWLTGVEDIDGEHPQNWILSGDDFFGDESCYNSRPRDHQKNWQRLADGKVSHFRFLRNCGSAAPVGGNSTLNINTAQIRSVLSQTSSVDLIFTQEKEKWTRSVVIELCDDENLAQGSAQKMKPRNAPSVDKNGFSAGHPDYNAEEGDLISTTGMGWFPGYAIDVETGSRLNVVFGENSSLAGENGTDMKWNPTANTYSISGEPIYGGQHVIYVMQNNIDNSDMPIYDSCAWFLNKISTDNQIQNRDAWKNATWTMYPILREGHTLLEDSLLVRMRVSKAYENLTITDVNDGRPAFEWGISSLLSIFASIEESNHLAPSILVYPNPTSDKINLTWTNMQPKSIQIYSMQGVLVLEEKIQQDNSIYTIHVDKLSPGVYVVVVGEVIKNIIVK